MTRSSDARSRIPAGRAVRAKMYSMAPIRLGLAFGLFVSVALCQAPPSLSIRGLDGKTVVLSVVDLTRLPQQSIHTTDHDKPVTFQGVLLTDVLAKVELPLGEKFHSTAASYFVLAESHDGYRAVFAWAELDSTFMDKPVCIATRRDGQSLSEKDGPFQLVVPGEKRPPAGCGS
jgi:hypothetical protein